MEYGGLLLPGALLRLFLILSRKEEDGDVEGTRNQVNRILGRAVYEFPAALSESAVVVFLSGFNNHYASKKHMLGKQDTTLRRRKKIAREKGETAAYRGPTLHQLLCLAPAQVRSRA